MKYRLLTLFLVLSSCIGMKSTGTKVNGGKMELIEKPGLLGSRGLRVVGEPIRFSDGKCFLSLEVSELPLQGDDWPYLVELRFFSLGSVEGESLDPQVARRMTVKYRLENSTSKVVGSDRLSTEWIRTARELGRDFYYYPTPKENMGLRPFIIMERKPVRLFVELSVTGPLEDEISANISIRTGGTK